MVLDRLFGTRGRFSKCRHHIHHPPKHQPGEKDVDGVDVQRGVRETFWIESVSQAWSDGHHDNHEADCGQQEYCVEAKENPQDGVGGQEVFSQATSYFSQSTHELSRHGSDSGDETLGPLNGG